MALACVHCTFSSAWAGEGAEINAAIYETMDSLALYMPWARERPTPEQTEEHIRRGRAHFAVRPPAAFWCTSAWGTAAVTEEPSHDPRQGPLPRPEVGT